MTPEQVKEIIAINEIIENDFDEVEFLVEHLRSLLMDRLVTPKLQQVVNIVGTRLIGTMGAATFGDGVTDEMRLEFPVLVEIEDWAGGTWVGELEPEKEQR